MHALFVAVPYGDDQECPKGLDLRGDDFLWLTEQVVAVRGQPCNLRAYRMTGNGLCVYLSRMHGGGAVHPYPSSTGIYPIHVACAHG